VTDSGSEVRRDPEKPGVTNLIEIISALSETSAAEVERELAEVRYGELKAAAVDAVREALAPLQDRYAELRPQEEEIESVLARGAEKAQALAAPIVAEVRERMGYGASSPK